MPIRQRQFSQVRSRASSRCHSQISDSTYMNQSTSFLSSFNRQNNDCVSCVNKQLTQSKREESKRKQQEEINEHLETIKRINSKRDHQRQHRQKMLLEAAQYNKSLAGSQRQSLRSLKQIEDIEVTKQHERKERQFDQNQQNHKRSRRQLESKYREQLKSQLKQESSRKQLQFSRSRFEDPSNVNNLKLIEENDQYVRTMEQEKIKCQKQNKKLLLEKSMRKFEEKEKALIQDRTHLERVQKEFQTFTEFQSLQSTPYKKSRLIISFDNPEDVFTQMKKTETQKTLAKMTQRKVNNNERALQLKRLEEENRAAIQKKFSSMKSYVEDLTNQLISKRQREAEQTKYMKHYQPEKSKVDYFTQEAGKQIKPCSGCDKYLQKKYFGA